jgi:hypothetical protein
VIHEIAVDLRAALIAQGCPIPVVDGPETTDTAAWSRERIVVEHGDADAFDPPWSQNNGISRRRMTRRMACKVKVYAQSALAGALFFEHRRRCDHILDLVLVALSGITYLRKGHQAFLPDGGGYFDPPDLEDSKLRGGCAYELRFTFDRAIQEQTWDGDHAPTAEITGDSGGVSIAAQNARYVKTNGSAEEPF